MNKETTQDILNESLGKFEKLLHKLLNKNGNSIYECQLTYMQAEVNTLRACINGIIDTDLKEVEYLNDGFGNEVISFCLTCGEDLNIIRPGNFQCPNCG